MVECEGCKQKFLPKDITEHQNRCKQFIDLNQARLAKNLLKVDTSKQTSNRSTFACPFGDRGCAAVNLDCKGLIDHLQKIHRNEGDKTGICPVCVSMPWGDPNYVCNNVINHIQRRHQFDYIEYVDYAESQDEDAVLAAVLAKSLADQ